MENTVDAADLFEEVFRVFPSVRSQAPGRLEVLGNHTDYNEGYVLSVAVDLGTEMAFDKVKGTVCKIFSPNMGDGVRSFDLNDIAQPLDDSDWTNYIRGVVVELQKRNYPVHAFNAVINSNMPISAGMSSSASIEMALICGLCELFEFDISLEEKAIIGQECENNYIGANTGLLDQLSSLSGKKDFLVVSEYRNLSVKHTPIPPELTLVVINSGISHDLSCEYNERRKSCEEATGVLKSIYPKVTSLRDVSSHMLEDVKGSLSLCAYLRARHIIEENDRVKESQTLLNQNKLKEFGQLLFDSHKSSIENFENSCEELDFIVESARNSGMCLGARLSGGGFGGISIHLVKAENVNKYLDYIKSIFKDKYLFVPDTYVCRSASGACAYTILGAGVNVN